MHFTLPMSLLPIIWKTGLKEGLTTWDITQQVWFMNRNLKSSGSIAKIRIYKIKEGMKKKEK